MQGILALLALNTLEADTQHPCEAWGSADHLHTPNKPPPPACADIVQRTLPGIRWTLSATH